MGFGEQERFRRLVGRNLGGRPLEIPEPLPVIEWDRIRQSCLSGAAAARGRESYIGGFLVQNGAAFADGDSIAQIPAQGPATITAPQGLVDCGFCAGVYRVQIDCIPLAAVTAAMALRWKFLPAGIVNNALFKGQSSIPEWYCPGNAGATLIRHFEGTFTIAEDWMLCLFAGGALAATPIVCWVSVEMVCGLDTVLG